MTASGRISIILRATIFALLVVLFTAWPAISRPVVTPPVAPPASNPTTDTLHRIEAVAVTDYHVTYRSAATLDIVDSLAVASRFEPSVLPAVTEQVPGVFITGRGVMGYGASTGAAGGMSIRGIGGSPTAGVLVMIDGMPQYMGLMGHPLADSYLSGTIGSVQVVRGAASALHGSSAMGGVINITTREMHTDGTRTSARLMYGSFNTASATIGTSFRRKGFTSFVSLDHNRSDGHRPNMNFSETGGAARLGYELSERWRVDGGIDIDASRSSNPGTTADPILDNDADIVRGSAYVRFGNTYDTTRGSIDIYHNFGRHDINNGYFPAEAEAPPLQWFHSKDRMSGVNLRQSVSLVRIKSEVAVGAEFRAFGGLSYNNVGIERTGERNESLWEAAAYLNYSWSPAKWINLNGTIRADYHRKAGLEWIPQLGLVINPARAQKPVWLVKASAGKGFRNPTIRELYILAPSNPDLGAERTMNYDLSVEYTSRRAPLRAALTLFFIDGSGIIQTVIQNSRPRWMNVGRVRNYGIEVEGSWQPARHLTISANYTWLGTKYKVTGAPEHKLYFSTAYSRPVWGAETGLQYIGKLYTQVTPRVATQSYLAWNLRAWWNISHTVRIFARVENLLDRKYEIMAGYPMPGITVFGGIDLNF